jgi:sugar lactone lactonase YvrE
VAKLLIRSFAGNGDAGSWGDEGLALNANLKGPAGVTVDRLGNAYFADYDSHRVKWVDGAGILHNFAGMGAQGFSGDGGPAVDAQLYYPFGVTLTPDGEVAIADFANARIRLVDKNGIIRTAVGGGIEKSDGTDATKYSLGGPTQVAYGPDGTMYIDDFLGNKILKVKEGKIYVFAGKGSAGFSGDGGKATAGEFNQPAGIALDSAGNLFVADYGNHRIRRIAPDGTLSTMAGSSAFGSTGDGGPAVDAQLNQPAGVAVDAAGNVLVADTGNNRIRKIAPDGKIYSLAGSGLPGFFGENQDASIAQFDGPLSLGLAPGGRVLVSDYRNKRLRILIPSN